MTIRLEESTIFIKVKLMRIIYGRRVVSLNSREMNASILTASLDEKRALIQSKDKCDKYDYLLAVACGAIGGS